MLNPWSGTHKTSSELNRGMAMLVVLCLFGGTCMKLSSRPEWGWCGWCPQMPAVLAGWSSRRCPDPAAVSSPPGLVCSLASAGWTAIPAIMSNNSLVVFTLPCTVAANHHDASLPLHPASSLTGRARWGRLSVPIHEDNNNNSDSCEQFATSCLIILSFCGLVCFNAWASWRHANWS